MHATLQIKVLCKTEIYHVVLDRWTCSTHGRDQIHTKSWMQKRKLGSDNGRHKCRWEDTVRTDLRKTGGNVGTGFFWLRIGTSSGLSNDGN